MPAGRALPEPPPLPARPACGLRRPRPLRPAPAGPSGLPHRGERGGDAQGTDLVLLVAGRSAESLGVDAAFEARLASRKLDLPVEVVDPEAPHEIPGTLSTDLEDGVTGRPGEPLPQEENIGPRGDRLPGEARRPLRRPAGTGPRGAGAGRRPARGAAWRRRSRREPRRGSPRSYRGPGWRSRGPCRATRQASFRPSGRVRSWP